MSTVVKTIQKPTKTVKKEEMTKLNETTKPTKPKPKPVELGPAKTSTRSKPLSEEEKSANPDEYIFNEATGKHVKRDSAIGKKLAKAQETGDDSFLPMTEAKRLVKVVKVLSEKCGIPNEQIKEALKSEKNLLPNGFPTELGGKEVKSRHPDHPKQPLNAFIFYCEEERAKVIKSNPGIENKKIISVMSSNWKELSSEERKPYVEMAEQDKERYEKEMLVFEKEHPDEARSSKGSPSHAKPTKKTAYHIYVEDTRKGLEAENPTLDGKQITKLLAEKWSILKKTEPLMVEEYNARANDMNVDLVDRLGEFHAVLDLSKLSKLERAKAEDTVHYRLNPTTGNYVLKEGWSKKDGVFIYKNSVEKNVGKTVDVEKSVKSVKTVGKTVEKSEKSVKPKTFKQVETVKKAEVLGVSDEETQDIFAGSEEEEEDPLI